MKKYSVLVKGKNLMVSIGGETCKHGFFTTRYVKADNESEAKIFVIDLIKEELGSTLLNDPDDSPKYLFEDIFEIESFEGRDIPGAGFTWFEEN